MRRFLQENFKTAIIIVLFLLMIITGYYAYVLREQYINTRLNTYNEAFSNVVNYVNNVENYLAKAMISKTPEYSADTLVQIWRDSNLASAYLSQIPLTNDALMQTSKFLNQVSDYSYTISKKNIRQEELTPEDFDNLETFHRFALDLENTLNNLDDKYLISEIIKVPSFMEGKILKDLLEQINKSMVENVNRYKYKQEDYKEYIELWIHEIKIPIAASKLIIENNKNEVTKSIDEELNKVENYIEQALYYARSNTVEKDY